MATSQNRSPGRTQRAAGEKSSGPDKKQVPATAPDLLVIMPLKDFSCAMCGGSGSFLVMDDPGALCLSCADLDHLVFLPATLRCPGARALTAR